MAGMGNIPHSILKSAAIPSIMYSSGASPGDRRLTSAQPPIDSPAGRAYPQHMCARDHSRKAPQPMDMRHHCVEEYLREFETFDPETRQLHFAVALTWVVRVLRAEIARRAAGHPAQQQFDQGD